ncbi:MAG: hypothetical protein P4L85_14505 [Paludisphaera borealis]|uniref:hypothetical protein n=1 Tax=Paludisphaera borealis TaxID=1387353 RepID=UPI002849C1C8|nr:hypothetical protein [Paludisphaera borealis]MDR3620559.1 hypothetical protein [Paludisphaera borealis]
MRRVQPMMDGLEQRCVMSATTVAQPLAQVVSATESNGVFSNNDQKFAYSTPEGTRVAITIKGRGSLEGTFVDSAGALNLRYGRTNSYTKITSDVHGGTGRALLATIYSHDQAASGTTNSLSGIGSPLIGMINLRKFDLIPNGTVNVTAGIGTLGLRSAGPNSQIQLRDLPVQTTTTTTTSGNTTTTTTTTTSGSLSTTSNNINNSVVSNVFLVQTLAGSDGEFVSAGNLLLQSTNGNPGPPPAPPGVVVAIDHVNGDAPAPDLLNDVRIFGYDPVAGQVVRFQLNLQTDTGVVDTAFAPIKVAGAPADVGVALGRDNQRQVLLVDSGTTVSVYDATYGTALGSFSVPAGFSDVGSTDSVTVIGNTTANQLQMLDVAASLAAGTVVQPVGNPASYTPPSGLSLLGGLTGLPGSNQVYTSVAAPFNSLQPLENQLGYLNVSTTTSVPLENGSLSLLYGFSTVQQKAFTQGGNYVAIPAGNPNQTAVSVGSVDRSLAVNTVGTNSSGAAVPNTVQLYGQVSLTSRGPIVINYPNQLTDLSESFRPDLAGTVLIDIQGNVQSVRGTDANGLVLNNAGNLNLVSFRRMSNSTIIGEPVTHINIQKRTNVSIFSTARTVGSRNGVTVVPGLQEVGPLSQPHDRPQA